MLYVVFRCGHPSTLPRYPLSLATRPPSRVNPWTVDHCCVLFLGVGTRARCLAIHHHWPRRLGGLDGTRLLTIAVCCFLGVGTRARRLAIHPHRPRGRSPRSGLEPTPGGSTSHRIRRWISEAMGPTGGRCRRRSGAGRCGSSLGRLVEVRPISLRDGRRGSVGLRVGLESASTAGHATPGMLHMFVHIYIYINIYIYICGCVGVCW